MKFSPLRERYRAFRQWQQRSYHVPVRNATVEHDCPTCETHFCGNFCPNCGQPAAMKRYSARLAFLHFLDAWGLGSDILYRTLRDLLLRPGYLIRDYLNGKRMAYFPPIKLMFLVLAFLYLAGLDDAAARKQAREQGLQLQELKTQQNEALRLQLHELEEELQQLETASEPEAAAGEELQPTETAAQQEEVEQEAAEQETAEQEAAASGSGEEEPEEDIAVLRISLNVSRDINHGAQLIVRLQEQYPNLSRLVFLVLVWLFPLYWKFRRMKTIENFRIAEAFITLLYTFSMRSILKIPYVLLYLHTSWFDGFSPILTLLSLDTLLLVYPMKQLAGYSWLRTLWKVLLCTLLSLLLLTAALLATMAILVVIYS